MFYQVLKELRKEKGFTIREVAERSGVSAAYISQLENGNRGVPSPEVLMKLSEGLNTSYAALMKAAGYLQDDGEVRPGKSGPVNLRRLIRDNELMFDGIVLTQEDKEWLERMLTAMFWREKRKKRQREQTPADNS